MPFSFGPNSTFSRTRSHGKSVYDWKTIPRSVPGPWIWRPSSWTLPEVGRGQAEDPDRDDAGDDLVRLEEAARREDHVADAGARGDELGDDQVRPRPADPDPHVVEDARPRGRQEHTPEDLPARGAERVGDVQEFLGDVRRYIRDQQREWEEDPDEDDGGLFLLVDAE